MEVLEDFWILRKVFREIDIFRTNQFMFMYVRGCMLWSSHIAEYGSTG